VARELGISHQTARSYLKTAFRKTNTCRQGELIGLLLGGPSNLPV
jgi:DNA-binding CsgD family transcriptional regulator